MNVHLKLLPAILAISLTTSGAFAAKSFLDNGIIKVGVDLTEGGSIAWLSQSGTTNNIISDHDLGREIQQSYYSGPQPYNPSNNMYPTITNWPWNPIQAGDVYGNMSTLLASTNDGQTIYVKCQPLQWALDNVPGQCTFEDWISLSNNVVIVSNRLVNLRTDTALQFSALDQELPALYTVGTLYRLFSYAGDAPFTDDTLTNLPSAPPPWVYWHATENWAALVDTNNWGLGVYHPGAVRFVGGFGGTPGSGGPNDDPTGYIAPLYTEILDTNIVYTYNYDLILDTLTNIRAWVYSQPRQPDCNFVFQNDRQHWSYVLAGDSGWPITNCLHVSLNSDDPQTWSPWCGFWASNVPNLYIRAAYQIANPAGRAIGQLFWQSNGAPGFSQAASAQFPLVVDGQYHTYALHLASSNDYGGFITQLRFDPAYNGQPGDFVNISAVSSDPFAGNNLVTRSLSIVQTNGSAIMTFPTVSGTNAGFINQKLVYDLQGTSNLMGGTWQDVPGYSNITGDNQPRSFTNTSSAAAGFYRLSVRLQ